MASVASEVRTVFHLHEHPVRMTTWNGMSWFIATDLARAVGRIRLDAMRRYVCFKHQRVLPLRLPEGDLSLLVFSGQGLGPVLTRRGSALASELVAKMATFL